MNSFEYLYKNKNMDKNINSKSTPNQMRVFMKRIREGKFETTEIGTPKKDLSMRDMLKITRSINEDVMADTEKKEEPVSKKTIYDEEDVKERFINYFKDADLTISAKFVPLEVYDSWVFWGGEIDGVMAFIYSVTPEESTSVYEIKPLEDFSPDAPKNELIAKLIETYYQTFKEYWRDNMIQK